jgi:hypothetical protein
MSVGNFKEETPRKQDYKTRRGSQENIVAARQGITRLAILGSKEICTSTTNGVTAIPKTECRIPDKTHRATEVHGEACLAEMRVTQHDD